MSCSYLCLLSRFLSQSLSDVCPYLSCTMKSESMVWKTGGGLGCTMFVSFLSCLRLDMSLSVHMDPVHVSHHTQHPITLLVIILPAPTFQARFLPYLAAGAIDFPPWNLHISASLPLFVVIKHRVVFTVLADHRSRLSCLRFVLLFSFSVHPKGQCRW